jgi:hypothetical protein
METGDRAVAIANAIDDVIVGQETAAVYLAIGMVLGVMASRAERPDLCGLMRIIDQVAHSEMARALADKLPRSH